MSQPDTGPNWWEVHDNLVTLVRHLAATGSTADDIVYAVEKPWKFTDEFEAALVEARRAEVAEKFRRECLLRLGRAHD